MKYLIFLLYCSLLFNCNSSKNIGNKVSTKNTDSIAVNEDEEEWDIYVSDPQYETFLLSIAEPKSFWTEDILKAKNQFLVTEWNYRASQPFNYDPNFYENTIEYDSNKSLGLDFEYKLYMFFKFIEWKYKVKL